MLSPCVTGWIWLSPILISAVPHPSFSKRSTWKTRVLLNSTACPGVVVCQLLCIGWQPSWAIFHWILPLLTAMKVGKSGCKKEESLECMISKTILPFSYWKQSVVFLSLFRTPGLRFDSTRGLHPVGSGRICCRSFLARKEPSRSRGTSSTPAMAPTLQNRPIESYSHKQNSEGGYRDSMSSMSSMFPVLKTSKDEIHWNQWLFSTTTPKAVWFHQLLFMAKNEMTIFNQTDQCSVEQPKIRILHSVECAGLGHNQYTWSL